MDVIGVGALNVDYIASATRLSERAAEQVSEGVARFEWNTEGPVDSLTVAKAVERLGAASLDASLGGSAWLTMFTLAQLRLGVRLGYVGVAGRIETAGLSFLRQMDELGIDRRFVARRPDLAAGVCLSYLEDVERVLLTHPGANFAMAEHLDAHRDEIADYLAAARVVHLTSFLDPHTPPVLRDVVAAAKRRRPELVVSFDPGFDWAEHPSEPVCDIVALTDLLFVNHRELKALANYAVGESDETLAQRILESCAEGATLFVTRRYDAVDAYRTGPAGLLARRFRLPRPVSEQQVEDATGAGDVFSAAVLAAIASRRLQVELGARIGLGLSRYRAGGGRGPVPALTGGLLATPEAPAGAGSRPRRVLLVHEGSNEDQGLRDVEEFLTRELRLSVRTVQLPATGTATPAPAAAAGADLAGCGFAICVLAATRTMAAGGRRAAEDVVHQVGLLQGFYGFSRVAILAEHGCEAPSNIAGLIRLDYPPGRIQAMFWELERMLDREGLLRERGTDGH